MSEDTATKTSDFFRSTLEQTIVMAEKIRRIIKDYPDHLEAIKKCPFWNFYRPFHEGRIKQDDVTKRQKGIECIYNTFDRKKQVFRIQGKEFKSTPEQLAVIFGLQRIKQDKKYDIKHLQMLGKSKWGDEDDPTLEEQKVFWKSYLGKRGMRKGDIIKSLYATAKDVTKPDDFVKLLVLQFCASIFFPTKGGGPIPTKLIKHVFAMDQVSWPDLIHSYMMEGLEEGEKPFKNAKGCSIYVLFWFAEITHLTSKNGGGQCKRKPRFARWNTRLLSVKLGNEGMDSLRQDLTGSFIDPLDEDEQSLITATEVPQANDWIRVKKLRVRKRNVDWELSPDRDGDWYLDDMAPLSLYKKRKPSVKESRPCKGNGSITEESAQIPSPEPMMPAIPNILTQESRVNENEDDDELFTIVKDLQIGSSSSPGFDWDEVGDFFGDSFDCLTPDSTLLTGSTSVDVITSCPPESARASSQERVEGFEFVGELKIPEEHESLYKKISDKHGHMATKKVIKFNDALLLECVTSLLKIISEMKSVPGAELSEALLEKWEGFIKDAESLEFNIKWLREGFNRLKNQFISSVWIDREVEGHKQVIDATQVRYDDLCTRKIEIETELSKVEGEISEAGATISSERKAIADKRTQKMKFEREPVLEVVLDEFITPSPCLASNFNHSQ